MTRLVQLARGTERRVAVVVEPKLLFLKSYPTVYALAQAALAQHSGVEELVKHSTTDDGIEFDPVYTGVSEWRLLTPIDHPADPARCLVSGTGLTHLGSAKDRQAMHAAREAELTDSMKMFRWGVEQGRPEHGQIGVAPEWFYKGNATNLRAHGEPLQVPPYAEDGGEEAEIAGIYLIDAGGTPHRIGMAMGNEFSDHKFEKRNYLNLAGSKIRTCALGPELVVSPSFKSVSGTVSINRGGQLLWSKQICSGEAEMCHSLQNIEHHHFKFESHRRPGDIHVHYYGACALSFGAGVKLEDGDLMEIQFDGFGRALKNRVAIASTPPELVKIGIL